VTRDDEFIRDRHAGQIQAEITLVEADGRGFPVKVQAVPALGRFRVFPLRPGAE
jgi:hypothetical protein